MKINLEVSSIQNILNLINAANPGANIQAGDVYVNWVGDVDPTTGFNSSVILSDSGGGGYNSNSQTFQYNRLTLDLGGPPPPAIPTTTVDTVVVDVSDDRAAAHAKVLAHYGLNNDPNELYGFYSPDTGTVDGNYIITTT